MKMLARIGAKGEPMATPWVLFSEYPNFNQNISYLL